jgi:hypothetical protein
VARTTAPAASAAKPTDPNIRPSQVWSDKPNILGLTHFETVFFSVVALSGIAVLVVIILGNL